MAGASTINLHSPVPLRATTESPVVKTVLVGITLVFFSLFLFLPLVVVFQEAFSKGAAVFFKTFQDPYTRSAIWLTLTVAAIAVPLNTIFGLAAAWSLTRFRFQGRSFLITLIDLPLWVSPVIGGLIYVLVFGAKGWLPPQLQEELLAPLAGLVAWVVREGGGSTAWLAGLATWLSNPKVIFAVPGIVLATVFVTFPFVARGLIPLMEAQGIREEEAALTLGANGWQIFWRVTLPKIKWGLLYGMILCNARAMGEFGAVSVVSGHISGKTNTMPLHIEILYNDYQFASAFAVSSLLALLAVITLFLKTYAEWRAERQLHETLS